MVNQSRSGELATLPELDESAPGVKTSPVTGRPIVDRRATDDSDEPRQEIASLSPGDHIRIGAAECKLTSTGKRRNFGQRGLYRLGIPPEAFGTVGTLYVDRDPYLLDICNGGIYRVDPADVEVLDDAA